MGEQIQGAPAVGEWATSSALVLRGGAWNIFSRIVPTFYTLVISIAAARFLGAEPFGRQSFIAFIELSLVFFLTTGISGGLTRYIGDSIGRERPQDVARMMRWAWLVEVVAALAGASVLVGAATAGADPKGAWLFAAIGCFVGVLHAVPSALLGGLQLWRAATIVGVVSGAFTAAATVAALAAGGGITEMFAIGAAGSIVNLAGTTLLARRALRNLPEPARSASRERRDLIRGLTRFSLASSYGVLVYLIVWRRSEFFFLEHFSGDLAVAIYSVPFAAVTALTQVPEALSAVVLPAFATLAGARAQERIRQGFARALRLLLLTTLPVTAAALALGPPLLEAVWGAEFEESGPVFLVMVAPLPLLALLYISKALATGLGKLRVVLLVDTAAALINVSLALLLIPRYDALGAAFAHVAAQVASAVPILVYALRLTGGTEWKPRALVPAALASAGAGAAAAALLAVVGGVAGLVLATVAGTAVFAILAVMLKILPREDAEWLETNAGRSVARLSRLVSGPALQAS